nr:transposase, mutator type [Tanacetum cinerariifolium]
PWPGQILIAVGIDANNGIYPVAYAIVEAESKASWCWFLNLLGEDLGIEANFNYTFISDRKRYCVKCIHENMKSQFKGGHQRRGRSHMMRLQMKVVYQASFLGRASQFRCGKCKNIGHNREGCRGQGGATQAGGSSTRMSLVKVVQEELLVQGMSLVRQVQDKLLVQGLYLVKQVVQVMSQVNLVVLFNPLQHKAHQLVQGMSQVNLVQHQAQQAKDQLSILQDQGKVFRHQDQVFQHKD